MITSGAGYSVDKIDFCFLLPLVIYGGGKVPVVLWYIERI